MIVRRYCRRDLRVLPSGEAEVSRQSSFCAGNTEFFGNIGRKYLVYEIFHLDKIEKLCYTNGVRTRGDDGVLLRNSRAALESGIRVLYFFALCRTQFVNTDVRNRIIALFNNSVNRKRRCFCMTINNTITRFSNISGIRFPSSIPISG